MGDLIKTTITLPEEIIRLTKIKAVQEKTTMSQIMRDALEEKIKGKKRQKIKDPMQLLGKFSLGVKIPYKHRSDLSDKHIKRKMGH